MIRWIKDKLHALAPDSEVEAYVSTCCEEARQSGADISIEQEMHCVSEAVRYHRKRRELHDFVVWAVQN